MKNKKTTEQIEDYLNDALSKEEKQAFEQNLENNNELKEMVWLEENLVKGIQNAASAEIRAQLEEFHQEMELTMVDETTSSETASIALELEMNMNELFEKLKTFTSKIGNI